MALSKITNLSITDDAVRTVGIQDNNVTLAKLGDGTQGDILYYGASGAPARLGFGTSGDFLKTQGTGANPAWATITSGLTEADMWRVTTLYSGLQNPITANWERADTEGFTQLGTGLTNSSGVFSFPSTGYYYVEFQATYVKPGDDPYCSNGIVVTQDDTNWTDMAYGIGGIAANTATSYYSNSFCSGVIDVVDVSLVKMRFFAGSALAGPTYTSCDGNAQSTGFSCFRLGDT